MSALAFELVEQTDDDGNSQARIRLIRRGCQGRPFAVTGDEPQLAGFRAAAARTAVADAGGYLFGKIMENPDIADQLRPRLADRNAQPSPILVSLSARGAERYPFEAMFVPREAYPLLSDGSRFLGLSERFAIGRMVDGVTAPSAVLPLRPPLQLTAVLSAYGIEARPQWEGLLAAIRAPGAVPTRLQVFVSERDLLDEVAACPEVAGVPGASASLVPGNPDDLQRRISEFAPHVLHFFCHGTAVGTGRLEIATANDREAGTGVSSVVLEHEQLLRFVPDRATGDPAWLVVLNCCETGGVGDELTSFSLRLMEEGQFGAVIGMSEPVLDIHATLFARGFYRSLLTEIGRRASGRLAEPLHLPAVAVAGRLEVAARPGRAISDAAAEFRDWTLPVVFVGAREWQLAVEQAAGQPEPPPPPPHIGGPPPPPDVGVPAAPADVEPPEYEPPAVEPEPPPAPAGTPPVLLPRREQLEVELLTSMLARLTPESPPALRTDIVARLAELGFPVAVE